MSGTDGEPGVVICVFTRAPVPGQVKTRLIPALGPDGAARLHAAMTRHVLARARAAGTGQVRLYCEPGIDHPFFGGIRDEFGITLRPQRGEDLGARMAAAVDQEAGTADGVVLVGADCPYLEPDDFRDVAERLRRGARAVVVPAFDGGYVLMGLKAPAPALFRDIAWGSGSVMEGTRSRLREAGLSWEELDPRPDVDRPSDIAALKARRPRVVAAARLDECLP